jgi:hypothetical protein
MKDLNRTNDFESVPPKERDDQPAPAAKPPAGTLPAARHKVIRPRSLWFLGLGALLLPAVSVAYGALQYNAQGRQVMRTAEQQRHFVPTVRVAKVRAADGEMTVSLPGTTLAFASANIFARANGYIETRKVDIGDRVKTGNLLAQITAPEPITRSPRLKPLSVKIMRRCNRRRQVGSSRASPTIATVPWSRKDG